MTATKNDNFAKVLVHPSQFPHRVYRDYLASFTNKKIHHKFHYDSVKQSQKWLKLHRKYSPWIHDPNCINSYNKCFETTSEILQENGSFQLIGLGSGDGGKDKLLLSCLTNNHREFIYYPVDVSLSLSIISAQKVRESFPNLLIQPTVCDLLEAEDLISQISQEDTRETRIITFFGMIPNFYPYEILPILSNFLETGDILLFSANLAPGKDYLEGIKTIFSQYDNELTRDWLITVLLDAGIEKNDGNINFEIVSDEKDEDIKRINTYFELEKDVNFSLDGEVIQWQKGDRIGLFFSYRYTTSLIEKILNQYQIKVVNYWESDNQEEGIYLCKKQ